MELNPFPLIKEATIRWTKPRTVTSLHRLAVAATELRDLELARLGPGYRLSQTEAGQIRGFIRAGGGVVVHR